MSEQLKSYGKVKVITPTVQVSDSFKKREVVITTEETYPQDLKFEFTQDNCSKADGLQVGQLATIFFNLRGREWTNKEGKESYFVSLNAWKVESVVMQQEDTTRKDMDDRADSDDAPF